MSVKAGAHANSPQPFESQTVCVHVQRFADGDEQDDDDDDGDEPEDSSDSDYGGGGGGVSKKKKKKAKTGKAATAGGRRSARAATTSTTRAKAGRAAAGHSRAATEQVRWPGCLHECGAVTPTNLLVTCIHPTPHHGVV